MFLLYSSYLQKISKRSKIIYNTIKQMLKFLMFVTKIVYKI